MRKLFVMALIAVLCSCSEKQLSPTETAQKVVESFYQKDNTTLKKYTTTESYEAFVSVQDLMAAGESGPSDFKVLEESIEGDTAEVKFTTSYEEKPETFKLIKVDGEWKVSEE